MEGTEKQLSSDGEDNGQRSYWWWVVGFGCLAVVLLGILLPRGDHSKGGQLTSTNQIAAGAPGSSSSSGDRFRSRHARSGITASAEEIVATKLSQFGRNRRDVMRGMAKRFKVKIQPDVERFFDTVKNRK